MAISTSDVKRISRKVKFAAAGLFDCDPVLASLNRHLALRLLPTAQFLWIEGHIGHRQAAALRELVRHSGATRVAEVGFNAGHSAATLLAASTEMQVVSFDLGGHQYIRAAVQYINNKFPGRHQLILGRSQDTIPRYAEDSSNQPFDVVFIDGGHTEQEAWADLENCRRICASGGLVVLDDVVPDVAHGVGPARAWGRATDQGLVLETQRLSWPAQDGRPKRAIAVGSYR